MEFSNYDINERGILLIPANVTKPNKLSENCKIGTREIKMHNEVLCLPNQFAANARLLNYVAFSERIETIPEEAFIGCVRLGCVDLSNSLKVVEARAFKDCGLIYLNFKENLTQICEGAFLNCCLTKVDFAPQSKLLVIEKNAFAGNKKLKEIKLPESVMEIGEGAFAGCIGIKRFFVGPNVVKMGNPFKSELYIHKGKASLPITLHLKSAVVIVPGLEPIKAKDFIGLDLDAKTNLRLVYTNQDVFVERVDHVRGVSEFQRCSWSDFENIKNEARNDETQKIVNEALLHDYLKQSLHIEADTLEFDYAELNKLVLSKSQFVELNFKGKKIIDASDFRKFCHEHTNYLLEYFKTQNPNLDAVAIRTHQLNWQQLYATFPRELKQIHKTALDLMEFKQKIFMATFGDSFDNVAKDKVSAEQLSFLIKEGERQLESKWLEAAEDQTLAGFASDLTDENNRLCKALAMQDYLPKLNIDKESFYQLADILVQNPNQWEEYLNSSEDSVVVGYIKSLQHEYDWQNCYMRLSKKLKELYNHYRDDLLPAELRRSKVKFTKKELTQFVNDGVYKFQCKILQANELERPKVMEKFVHNMEKAHTFAVECRLDAEKQFKQKSKPPKDKDEFKKWQQDLAKAGEDAYYAKYNEVMQKVENDKVDYLSILHVCKVNFKGKPVEKNLLPVVKLRGKIAIKKFKALQLHIDSDLQNQFL